MKKILLLAALLAAPICHAGIFQCTTSTGKTEFRDAPCDNKSASKNLTSSLQVKSVVSLDSIRDGRSICRPQFHTSSGKIRAGTAFFLDYPNAQGSALLVTAHHLFGPAGGMAADISWQQLPQLVTAASCETLAKPSLNLSAGSALPVRDAQAFSRNGNNRDIALFPLKNTPPFAIKLASTSPQNGETVYLVAQVSGEGSHYLHKAVVTGNHQGLLEFSYEKSGLSLNASSGAPVINAQGAVVGINVGGRFQGTAMTGLAVNLKQINTALAGLR